MAKKQRKRSVKKIDKELSQLLKEKDKIDDLTIVKEKSTEKKKPSSKKKDSVVVPERKRKTTKKQEAIVTPERKSSTRKKAQTHSVTVSFEEKKKIKKNGTTSKTKKTQDVSQINKKDSTKPKSIVIPKKEKNELKKKKIKKKESVSLEKDSISDIDISCVVEKSYDKVDYVEGKHSDNLEDTLSFRDDLYDTGYYEDGFHSEIEEETMSFEKTDETDPYEVGIHSEVVDDTSINYDDVGEYSDIDDNVPFGKKRYQELENEVRGFYENTLDEVSSEPEVKEDTGILVTDLAIRSNEEEPVVRRHNFLTILTIILFVIFVLLLIAFIAFIIYVCTY